MLWWLFRHVGRAAQYQGLALIARVPVVAPRSELEWLRWNYESDQKQQDDSDEITAKQGFIMAVSDPKTWLMCGTLYATYTAAAVNNFFPTVVAGLGFGTNESYGLTAVSTGHIRVDLVLFADMSL